MKNFYPTHKKEQKTLPRLKFTAKNPQREHNKCFAIWRSEKLIDGSRPLSLSFCVESFVIRSRHIAKPKSVRQQFALIRIYRISVLVIFQSGQRND